MSPTTTASGISPEETANPRTLVTADLFGRLAARVAAEQNIPGSEAERVVEQALAFLAACALNLGARLSPSRRVDPGWHAFLQYTLEYAEFCDRIAGRFIHHVPDDTPGMAKPTDPAAAIGATVAAMCTAGLPVDTELWVPDAKCSQCYAGCADDPKREN
jgi:hypothetical protein